ncbi:MAG: amidohydrolase family protein [Bifidobacteriaceae bacterium]|jgi:imidazolonepropionase-like amidohydrolase|nr:amidohydrolase family protein [Bifidobacteriaceae bacterium]
MADPSTQTTVYSADGVLTGALNEHLPNASVVTTGAEIAWVGPTAALPAEYARASRTNLPGVTLLPGLIEVHGHLGHFPGTPPDANNSEQWSLAAHFANARVALSVGVTTIRSLGALNYTDVGARDAINAGLARGPRLLAAGPIITATGGHAWRFGGEADTIAEIRHLVRTSHKRGVDVIKVAATGGFMTPGSSLWAAQFTTKQLRALVDDAHRLGKNTAAHAHGAPGVRRALRAGIDTLEHVSFLTERGTSEFDPVLADEIAEAGRPVDITISWSWPALYEAGKAFKLPIQELHGHGVQFIAGTDAAVAGYVGGLKALHYFGLPVNEVLVAATSRAAEAIGLKGVAGRLQAGHSADLIGAKGNPLESLDALDDLALVVARGEEFAPEPVGPLERFLPPVPPDSKRSLAFEEEQRRWARLHPDETVATPNDRKETP